MIIHFSKDFVYRSCIRSGDDKYRNTMTRSQQLLPVVLSFPCTIHTDPVFALVAVTKRKEKIIRRA